MAALVRGEKFETRAKPHFEGSDKRRSHLGARQVEPVGGANALAKIVLHGQKIGDDERKRLIIGGTRGARRAQADTRRRIGRAHKPSLDEAIAKGTTAEQTIGTRVLHSLVDDGKIFAA